jgi:hypothetical protein
MGEQYRASTDGDVPVDGCPLEGAGGACGNVDLLDGLRPMVPLQLSGRVSLACPDADDDDSGWVGPPVGTGPAPELPERSPTSLVAEEVLAVSRTTSLVAQPSSAKSAATSNARVRRDMPYPDLTGYFTPTVGPGGCEGRSSAGCLSPHRGCLRCSPRVFLASARVCARPAWVLRPLLSGTCGRC